MPIPAHLFTPPGDFRLWIDGSYKDGWIGYGVVVLPGYQQLTGGRAGESAKEAEFLAAEAGISAVPEGCEVVIYCDFLPLVKVLNSAEASLRYHRTIRAQYMNDNDPRHREAHELANRGRIKAAES